MGTAVLGDLNPSPLYRDANAPAVCFDDRTNDCEPEPDTAAIAAVLLELDALHREVLVLRFHEELSLEEIAKVTQAPLSTVKSRLYRGLAAIKPKLERASSRFQGAV